VKRIWIDEKRTPEENKFTFEFIPARVTDNEYIMKYDPQYIENLEAIADPNKKKALLYGDWNIFD
jgi:phage terminase large subunit